VFVFFRLDEHSDETHARQIKMIGGFSPPPFIHQKQDVFCFDGQRNGLGFPLVYILAQGPYEIPIGYCLPFNPRCRLDGASAGLTFSFHDDLRPDGLREHHGLV
jgi:hypothetical protein